MHSRERVIRAIEMTGPDRVPIMHVTLPGASVRYGEALESLYREYPEDVVKVGSATYGEFGPEIGEPSCDPWGSQWVRHTDEHKGQVVFHPVEDWSTLDSYQPPDTATDAILAAMKERIEQNSGHKYALADGDTLFQRMYYLHGFQATNEDLLVEPERCAQLRDMILEVILRRLRRLTEVDGLDGVHFRDDWGTQTALLIRPGLWRDFFQPAYTRMFDIVRQAGKHVWFHSDGVIDPIIPDLIDMGVDVLNPQCNCMPRERLGALVAGKVCLLGDLDRQWTLPSGTPDDVRAAVRMDVETYGRFQGGLVLRGEIAGDVPLENVQAMLDEMTHYGRAVLSCPVAFCHCHTKPASRQPFQSGSDILSKGTAMTPRERILTALNHERPDRTPTDGWFHDEVIETLKGHYRTDDWSDVLAELGIEGWTDLSPQVVPPDAGEELDLEATHASGQPAVWIDEHTYEDVWGARFRLGDDGRYRQWLSGPLQETTTAEELDGYRMLRDAAIREPEDYADRVAELKRQQLFVTADLENPFRRLWNLRGMENSLMDYVANIELLEAVYDPLYELFTRMAVRMTRAGVDMIRIVGDIAMHDRIMMGAERWRRFDKPRMAGLIGACKAIRPDIEFFFHSDGRLTDLVDDLIEAGISVLNPIQPECMDPVEVKRRWGDRITLHGCISIQRTLPFGSASDVRREVEGLIQHCGQDGGLILMPSNVIQPDTPIENIIACYHTARDFNG